MINLLNYCQQKQNYIQLYYIKDFFDERSTKDFEIPSE